MSSRPPSSSSASVSLQQTDARRRLGSAASTQEAVFAPAGIEASCCGGAASLPLVSAAVSEDLRKDASRNR